MSTYVSLVKLTSEGVKDLKEWARNYDGMKKGAEAMGVKITGAYALLGSYDMMFISEAADEKTAMMQAIFFTSRGATVETWTAVPMEEFTEITRSIRAFL